VVPDGYPLPAEYDVVACQRCGFVYADADATQADYDHFYSDWSKYDDSTTSTGGGTCPYDAARLTQTARDIARVLPSRAATILDVGCATGGLLTALHEQGFSLVAGLDPSPRCAAACRDRGFQAYAGFIGATPAHMPRFDCLVFSHVLEHVYDISSFFNAARRALTPGGFLYIETPDASRYQEYLYAPFQEFNTEHINHFSARTLATAAVHHGFTPVVVEQKLLGTGMDKLYPAVFGIFQDNGGRADRKPIDCDSELSTRIAAYIRRSAEQMEAIDRHVASKLPTATDVIIWGAGQLAMKLAALPSVTRLKVRAFVDNNPVLRGKRIAGAPVVGPQEILGTKEPILIATLLHAGEIAANIRRLGLTNPIVELPSPSHGEGASA
jgi:2-polyprenyl-3-methyl-5-hydroxy-6-metoxy-1,4-benzoquinol methylase